MDNLFYLCGETCPRRSLDTQRIHDYLLANGWKKTTNCSKANLLFFSSCGYTEEQEANSIDAISFFYANKPKRATLVVTGCLPKINNHSLDKFEDIVRISPTELSKLDEIIEANMSWDSIPDPIKINDFSFEQGDIKKRIGNKVKKAISLVTKRDLSAEPVLSDDYFNNKTAMLRIAKGCVGRCSYCAIKFAAGVLVSKHIVEIKSDISKIFENGYKKVFLIAGDVGAYGIDIDSNIVELLDILFAQQSDIKFVIPEFNPQWVVSYYDDLLNVFRKYCDKIDHIIIPIQSASNRVLDLMCRDYKIEEVDRCLKALKTEVPSLKILTHVIVGFPGETVDDFNLTVNFLQQNYFDDVYVYKYSDRPLTTASKMAEKVSQEVIDARADIIKRSLLYT